MSRELRGEDCYVAKIAGDKRGNLCGDLKYQKVAYFEPKVEKHGGTPYLAPNYT